MVSKGDTRRKTTVPKVLLFAAWATTGARHGIYWHLVRAMLRAVLPVVCALD